MLRAVTSRIARRVVGARGAASTADASGVWRGYDAVPDTPDGFTARFAVSETNPNGVEVIMEKWRAGAREPAHSHPGDDMTVVVEGSMAVQFFTKSDDGTLVKDGAPLVLKKGDAGHIAGGRIHDAAYLEDCKLVYVHDGRFGFVAEGAA
ncbi:predicted protein [Ostreococcus lucimarinus CCE9901]|uniref:Cupin 2 conserved barrel domain-containing protein n=1 Tax=Ostreococcus lucimarinus (strain CCE9901) TaxID=436017 RepID=A4RYJ8_OSTLU|nr:predicted protein [Ostreococcus lucimarinus CCE9901]ABO96468.1 predicted protein [Ostreococcus lucimarinus CCE9901]|eukprot:XP_001418175.1 predicted protein [Ostreococcus lucimarinus CCE9901]